MSLISSYQRCISDLSSQLDDFIRKHRPEATHEEVYVARFHAILVGIADIVHSAETTANSDPTSLSPSDVQELIMHAERLINRGIVFAYDGYSEDRMYAEWWIPSFAHKKEGPGSSPLLETKKETGQVLLQNMTGVTLGPDIVKAHMDVPPAWPTMPRLSSISSPCVRFRINSDLPAWNAAESNRNATTVVQARCEVSSDDVNYPFELRISGRGDMLALSAMGGYKNRTPYLHYYFPHGTNVPSDTSENKFMRCHTLTLDLAGAVEQIAVDEDRRLIFVADNARIKSYRYNTPHSSAGSDDSKKKRRANDNRDTRLRAVHTLNCGKHMYEGPLTVLPEQGRVLRAGKRGMVAVWDLDGQPTHGKHGTDIIGKEMDGEDMDTWRDDDDEIEPSKGSKLARTVKLEIREDAANKSKGWNIQMWHRHPSKTNIMICGSDVEGLLNYHCHAFDIEAGGKAVARYLGHAGVVRGFSTSAAADPNVFLTYCDDGYARLYDTRRSMPVLTIAGAEAAVSPIPSAALVHPDGLPFIFVGEGKAQKITLWDVRAQKALYELATGNNHVQAMVWDDPSNTLYAATTCGNVDRNGDHHDYRLARIPKKKGKGEDQGVQNNGERLEDEEPDSEFEAQKDEICWPTNAYHSENYWGHVWDAGDHRLYKYSFKMEPNLEILPEYGCATVQSYNDYW